MSTINSGDSTLHADGTASIANNNSQASRSGGSGFVAPFPARGLAHSAYQPIPVPLDPTGQETSNEQSRD